MRSVLRVLALSMTGLGCGFGLATTIQYSVQDLNQNLYRITYHVNGSGFLANQELDIEFDPAVYLSLMNAVAPSGFDVLLFQPNDPPGADGRFSALALTNLPSTSNDFLVDVLMAAGTHPVAQAFVINQLSSSGVIVSTVGSGISTPASVPEPATVALAGTALLAGAVTTARRRRKRTGLVS